MTLADTYRDVAHQAMLDLVRQPREVVYAADPYIAALEAERQQEHTKRADLIVDLHRMTERAEQAEAEVARLNAAWKELRRQVAIYEKSGYDLYQRENGKAFGKMMDAVLGRPRGGRGVNIYLVTRGAYSDYCIVAAFSTRELAQQHIDGISQALQSGKITAHQARTVPQRIMSSLRSDGVEGINIS